jgi:hypothetical protein
MSVATTNRVKKDILKIKKNNRIVLATSPLTGKCKKKTNIHYTVFWHSFFSPLLVHQKIMKKTKILLNYFWAGSIESCFCPFFCDFSDFDLIRQKTVKAHQNKQKRL